MKRGVYLSLLFIMVLVLATGCGQKQKTMTCTRKGTITTGTTFDYNYKVTYTGKYVDELNIIETVKSDSSEYLETLKETVEAIYEPYDGIKYHTWDVSVKGDTLTSHRNIDYSKIDTDKLIEIDSANAQLIKDGKVSIDTVKSLYESQLGLTCK